MLIKSGQVNSSIGFCFCWEGYVSGRQYELLTTLCSRLFNFQHLVQLLSTYHESQWMAYFSMLHGIFSLSVCTYIPSNQSTNEQNTFCCYLQYSSNSKKYPSLPLKGANLKIAFLVERQISSVEIKTAVSRNVIVSVECDSFSI